VSTVDVQAVANRIAGRIGAAALDTEPCLNFYIEEVFPPDLYREMLARLPSDEALDFIVHPDAVAPEGRVTRKLLDLTDKTLARLHSEDQAFWRDMMAVFTSATLQDALAETFRPSLEAQFGPDRPAMVSTPVFYRDFPGYRISVHPDAPWKVATLQFYLPADESQVHLGTTFHKRTDQGFRELKTNPFKPNSAYGFVRTEESWHSVKELGPNETTRNTIALTIYHRGMQYRSDAMM
jgi:hypothetical protein